MEEPIVKTIFLLKAKNLYKVSVANNMPRKLKWYKYYNPFVELITGKISLDADFTKDTIIRRHFNDVERAPEGWGGWKELTTKELNEVKKLIRES